MLSTATKELLKSLAIKVGFGIVAVIADTLSQSLTGFHIPAAYATIAGLFVGELSQWAHTHYDLGGRIARSFIPRKSRAK